MIRHRYLDNPRHTPAAEPINTWRIDAGLVCSLVASLTAIWLNAGGLI